MARVFPPFLCVPGLLQGVTDLRGAYSNLESRVDVGKFVCHSMGLLSTGGSQIKSFFVEVERILKILILILIHHYGGRDTPPRTPGSPFVGFSYRQREIQTDCLTGIENPLEGRPLLGQAISSCTKQHNV